MKLRKMKSDAECRLNLIEEFKKTLDVLEWNENKRGEANNLKSEVHANFLA